jgi:hypothetical protein
MNDRKSGLYSANEKDIEQYGIECAMLINYIQFYVQVLANKEINLHEGRIYMYHSAEQFQKRFHFWSLDKIGRHLRELEKKYKVLTSYQPENHFGKMTKHYAFIDQDIYIDVGNTESFANLQNYKLQSANVQNPESVNLQIVYKEDLKEDLKNIYTSPRMIEKQLTFFDLHVTQLKKLNPEFTRQNKTIVFKKEYYLKFVKLQYTNETFIDLLKFIYSDKYWSGAITSPLKLKQFADDIIHKFNVKKFQDSSNGKTAPPECHFCGKAGAYQKISNQDYCNMKCYDLESEAKIKIEREKHDSPK